jgi:surface antigen
VVANQQPKTVKAEGNVQAQRGSRPLSKIIRKRTNRLKKSFVRHGFVYANLALILIVTAVVWGGHNNATKSTSSSLLSQSSDSRSEAPLDTISSADIAANIAKVAKLPEAVTVTNQADSYNAQLVSANVDQTIVSKPQLVAGGTKSRKDIQKYVAVSGDSISSLATKFGVTSDSIRWSNSLSGENIPAGKELVIPPRNGVIYKVASGDTIESIAQKYHADKDQLVAFNDIEITGLPVGENILIPDGVQPVAPVASSRSSYADSGIVYGYAPTWGDNGYTRGYCTYYAASRVKIPNNWGNANTWAIYARLSGWTVSPRPIKGAIAQTTAGWAGHVAIVEDVSPDGAMMKYSDMNGICGYGCVGITKDWVPISHFQNYIYR